MRYGPQTAHVQALIERASQLTAGEIRDLAGTWDAVPDATWKAALDVRSAALAAAWEAVGKDAAWAAVAADAVWDAVWDAAAGAGAATAAAGAAAANAAADAGAAALALVCRHLIGDVFTWKHYRTLVDPVATVLGKLHPDD